MKKTILGIILIVSMNAIGAPKQFEVWFLSKDSTAWLDDILPKIKFSKLTAQRPLQCQKMGDHCFDPQVGLYKPSDSKIKVDTGDYTQVEKKSKYDFIEPAKSVDRSLINCEKGNFFDVFCGQTRKKKKKANVKLEVWVDVSSTMKQIDFAGFNKPCKRETFLRTLSKSCPLNQKMKVYHFEEFRQEVGAFDRVCVNGGLNNMKKLMDDVRESSVESIIIITDIYEADSDFINIVEGELKGTIRGLDKPIYAKDMHSELSRVGKLCQ